MYRIGHHPTEILQPQRIFYASRAHFTVVGFQKIWDIVPVEPAGSSDHPSNRLSSRISPRHLPFGLHHDLCCHLLEFEVEVVQLYSPLPPFTSGSAKMSRCCARARRKGGTTGVLD
jgi:hypothetical protein